LSTTSNHRVLNMTEQNQHILNPCSTAKNVLQNVYELDEYTKPSPHKPTISVIGLGYVGAVTSACFSKMGYSVIGVDSDKKKVHNINSGISPIFEEGLEKDIQLGLINNKLSATHDIIDAIFKSDITIISVGTPSDSQGGCKLTALEAVCREIGMALRQKKEFHTVIFKSTVPPSTTEEKLLPIIELYSGKERGRHFGVCFNPEFLRESTAIQDFYHPPITLIGTIDTHSASIASKLFADIDAEIHITTIAAAEFVKYIDNTWHATKVCFANEIGRLCHALHVDSQEVMEIFVKDTKLNISPYYLKPGFAYGGSCLPKDTRGIKHLAKSLAIDTPLINGIVESNDAHIEHVVAMVKESGEKNIGICGLTFKAGTDDMRESPNERLLHKLADSGLNVTFFDPLVSCQYTFHEDKEANAAIHNKRSLHINDFIKHSDIIILAHDDEYSELACRLANKNQKIIDLVGVERAVESNAQYQGICW